MFNKNKRRWRPRGAWGKILDLAVKPRVIPAPGKWKGIYEGENMLIATPQLVNEKLRAIPRGCVATEKDLRESLAIDFGAAFTCPDSLGKFLRIVAEAAEEDRLRDIGRITPYWRLIADDGRLDGHFPGGAQRQAELLREEGITIISGGNGVYYVADFSKYCFRFDLDYLY